MAKMLNDIVETKGEVGEKSVDVKDPLVEFIFKKLYPEALNYWKPFADNIKQNVKFFRGDQWTRNQPSYRSKSVTNYTSEIVRSEVAILTDSMPVINIRPVDYNGDPEIAMTLKKLVEHVMYGNNWSELFHKWVKFTSIKSIGYILPIWNARKNQGLGDIELILEQPWVKESGGVIRDPSGEDNFFIVEKKISLAEIYRNYQGIADAVRANVKEKTEGMRDESGTPPVPVQSTDGSATVMYQGKQCPVTEQYIKVPFHVVWLKDDSVKALGQDGSDEMIDVAPEPMYPYGRWVFIANKSIIVDDKPCAVKHFPLIPMILDHDPNTEICGISTIDNIKGSQQDYNQMYAMVLDWLRAVTVPKFTYDPKSKINPMKLKNKWGTGVPARPDQFRWDSPPPLPNDAFSFINQARNNIEYVSGIQDVTQGRRPANVVSAEAIRLLQESSKTVLRPKTRLIEGAVKRLGEVIIDLLQAGYTTQRMLRVLGYNTGMGEQMDVNTMQVVQNVESVKNDITIGEYDVYIEPDSTLPKSDIERMDRLIQMGQQGWADRQSILANSGLPNWQEINGRMQVKEDEFRAMQQQQMMQGQSGLPNQGPPEAP